ncbi:MAG: hypothetical protein H7270_09090 [Dermatophilaceae bacterium]|nr:hypothetical protein [Dermatophilaceae bacterium]
MVEYQYRVLVFPSGVSAGDLSRAITQEAEYGHWELSRLLMYFGGARKVWLRRKIIRVERTVWQGVTAQ